MRSQQNDDITRRRFVAGTLATGAAAALPAAAEARGRRQRGPHHKPARRSRVPRSADVVVVGAGVAGLTAARHIAAAGRSVVVLEARDRVGGRVWNHELGGGKVSERGGTFIGYTQDHIYALVKELGLKTFPTYDTGDNVYVNGSTYQRYSDTGPTGTAPPDPLIVPELAVVVNNLDTMSHSVPVDHPWDTPNASDLDGQTLQTYIANNSQRFKDLVPVATRPIFGAEPRELPLLFVLFYIAASGNEHVQGSFETNFDTRMGAQQDRIVGGSQLIPLRMAAQLRHVVLSAPVRRITQGRGAVTVSSDAGQIRAKRVIVAVPPTLAGRIVYEPLLPFERDQLTQRYGQGTLTKVAATYDKPFWRDAGFNGTAVDTGGPISATFDDSPPDGSPGVIFGFVGGDNARTYNAMSPTGRQNAVLNQLAKFFGPQALKARSFFDTSWSAEQWTRGCPVGIPATGALFAYGKYLRQPVGAIHWAGTETAGYWNGYMDGAVRSGERAAGEVLAEL